jgi:hypothetical protein
LEVFVAHLTARDIAKHIQRPGESLIAAVDRLRTWTKMGIIKPSGERHPGTGRKKRYSKPALLQAVLLQTLTDCFGSSAVSLRSLVEQVLKEVRQGQLFEPGVHVLVLSRLHDAEAMSIARVTLKDLERYISKSDLDVHTVLDLPKFFDRHRMTSDEWTELFPGMAKKKETSNG